jgi:hypothetical protein
VRGNGGVICILAAATTACSSGNQPAFDGNIALGTWGGDSAGMIVSDTAMHLHIDCTYGDVSGRVPVNANGEFDVIGSYTLRAYPIVVGPTLPARFVGRLAGNRVTLTVTVNDTVEHQTVVRGPVQVTFGDDPRLGVCPICRKPIVTRKRSAIFKW